VLERILLLGRSATLEDPGLAPEEIGEAVEAVLRSPPRARPVGSAGSAPAAGPIPEGNER